MKIINKYTFIASVLAMLMLVGCDDFIDLYPTNSISDEDMYSSIDVADAALIGLYNDTQTGNFLGRHILYRGDIKGPDFMLLTGNGEYFAYEYQYEESASSGQGGYIWYAAYQMIKDCNNFIDGISGLEDSEEKADMIAQAKALKGIAYFELTKVFCYPPAFAQISDDYQLGLPVIENKDQYTDIYKNGIARSTLTETFEYTEGLFIEALEDINKQTETGAYISKYAIYAYLAEMNLCLENWQEVIDYGEKAAEGASMMARDEYLNNIYTDNNAESIFEIANSETDYMRIGYYLNTTLNDEGRYDASVSVGYGDVGASDNFISLLQENSSDIRLELLGEDKLSNTAAEAPLVHGVDGYTARCYYKYPVVEYSNTPLMKLPEVYLMMAEAYSELGNNDATALAYLNKVFEARTGGKLSGLTGDNLKDAIFNERRRELALEGVAVYDYLRKMRGFSRDDSHNAILTIDPTSESGRADDNFHKVVCAVSESELEVNPLLVQNPGF